MFEGGNPGNGQNVEMESQAISPALPDAETSGKAATVSSADTISAAESALTGAPQTLEQPQDGLSRTEKAEAITQNQAIYLANKLLEGGHKTQEELDALSQDPEKKKEELQTLFNDLIKNGGRDESTMRVLRHKTKLLMEKGYISLADRQRFLSGEVGYDTKTLEEFFQAYLGEEAEQREPEQTSGENQTGLPPEVTDDVLGIDDPIQPEQQTASPEALDPVAVEKARALLKLVFIELIVDKPEFGTLLDAGDGKTIMQLVEQSKAKIITAMADRRQAEGRPFTPEAISQFESLDTEGFINALVMLDVADELAKAGSEGELLKQAVDAGDTPEEAVQKLEKVKTKLEKLRLKFSDVAIAVMLGIAESIVASDFITFFEYLLTGRSYDRGGFSGKETEDRSKQTTVETFKNSLENPKRIGAAIEYAFKHDGKLQEQIPFEQVDGDKPPLKTLLTEVAEKGDANALRQVLFRLSEQFFDKSLDQKEKQARWGAFAHAVGAAMNDGKDMPLSGKVGAYFYEEYEKGEDEAFVKELPLVKAEPSDKVLTFPDQNATSSTQNNAHVSQAAA